MKSKFFFFAAVIFFFLFGVCAFFFGLVSPRFTGVVMKPAAVVAVKHVERSNIAEVGEYV